MSALVVSIVVAVLVHGALLPCFLSAVAALRSWGEMPRVERDFGRCVDPDGPGGAGV